MKVKLVKVPMVKNHTMFSPIANFKTNIIKKNSVRFSVRYTTKTRLNITVESGESSFKFNKTSEYSRENDLTLVKKEDWNFLTGTGTINHYFKLTKKQNMKMFIEHIKSLAEQLFTDLHINDLINRETFIIELEMTNDLLEQVQDAGWANGGSSPYFLSKNNKALDFDTEIMYI